MKTIIVILLLLVILYLLITIINKLINNAHIKAILKLNQLNYDSQLNPKVDSDGSFYFKTDRAFKILQLTDLHIGAGFLTIKKDKMAINAIASMIAEEKPDLVVVTGDIAFPVPYYAGTLNNSYAPKLICTLMEKMGVYWIPVFGNHDTEVYSYFNREQIGNIYESSAYPHCLFKCGEKQVDGCGNSVINIKNSDDIISQSLVFLDSHSYTDDNKFGIMRRYDNIKDSQISYYKLKVKEAINYNKTLGADDELVKGNSLLFFHIPLNEYADAIEEYKKNNLKDSENVKMLYGRYGEKNKEVHCAMKRDNLFNTVKSFNAQSGIFCGHDHLNNCSLIYKGVELTYGYSIDYTAYYKISRYGLHRGCTSIIVNQDGSFKVQGHNYYEKSYSSPFGLEKEKVNMAPYSN